MPNVNPWNYLNYLNQHPANKNTLPSLQNSFPTPQPSAGARTMSRQPAGAGFSTPTPIPNPGIIPGGGHGTGVIGPPVKPPDSTPPGTPPASTTTTGPKPTAPPTAPKPEQNKGGVYYPKPTGSASRGAFRPVRFPGVETSGGSWAKYQDGSFVDYASENWKRAASIQIGDEQQRSLWDALPDSWKVDIASWDPAVRDAYLKALSNPNSGGVFQGQWMTGQQAAEMIAEQQHQTQEQQAQQKKNNQKYQKRVDKAQLLNVGQPRAYFVPR